MSDQRLLELRFPADPEQLRRVRQGVREASEGAGFDARTAEFLVLAVNEACMNVMQHAYQGDASGEIVLEVLKGEGEVEFRLRDFAAHADLARIRPRELDDVRPGGLGTHFIREIMDECEYAHAEGGRGNVLRMRKKLR